MKKSLALLLSLTLCLALVSCGDTSQPATTQASAADTVETKSPEEEPSAEPSGAPVESEEPLESEESEDKPSTLVDGMRPEFKEAMDSYEEFYMDYCDFMERYNANPSDMKLILEYAEMLKNVAEMDEAFEKWSDEDDMNAAELSYFIGVNARVLQRMVEVTDQ